MFAEKEFREEWASVMKGTGYLFTKEMMDRLASGTKTS
jgi:hypothetical protein